MKEDGKCEAEVVDRSSTWPRYHPCQRKAVRDGYCTIHHPEYIEAKRAREMERYENERSIPIPVKKWRAIQVELEAMRPVVDAAVKWADGTRIDVKVVGRLMVMDEDDLSMRLSRAVHNYRVLLAGKEETDGRER